MRHRGPDDEGLLAEPNAALGIRRLSIIDLDGGHQPIFNEDESIVIVFNGEIYNFLELRTQLEQEGHHFRTRTDTEVIIHLYEKYGTECLNHLRGMFAFAIYDRARRTLFIARDRIGIKPLVYSIHGTTLSFASEIKSLLLCPNVNIQLHLPALAEYLTHLYIPGENTIYKGIRRLPPAHYLIMDSNGIHIKRYWQLPHSNGYRPEEEWCEDIIEQLREAVREHLVSDVPVGAFLSGGIDSSAVSGLMSQVHNEKVRTYSIGFPQRTYSELHFARTAAKRFGTEHHEFMVEYPKPEEFLPQFVRCFSEPFADAAAVPTYLIAREASKHLKVVLSGNGGDELFAGYAKYLAEPITHLLSIVPSSVRRYFLLPVADRLRESTGIGDPVRRLRRILRYSLMPPSTRPLSWLNGFDPDMLRKLLKPEIYSELKDFDPLASLRRHFDKYPDADMLSRLLYTEFNTYLPANNLHKDDILGMAHSLEIRVPFLDHRLVELAFTIPSNLKLRGFKTKYILKKAFQDLLPAEILHRPKQGFSAPVGEWIKHELRPLCEQLFFQKNSIASSFFNTDVLRTLLNEHLHSRADHSHRLWALLIFFIWYQERH